MTNILKDKEAQRLIEQCFVDSERTLRKSQANMPVALSRAAQIIVAGLSAGHKILICGNGGSAADAQHFAAELVNRFECERRALPAIALTTDTSNLTSIANDSAYENIFARQTEALGLAGDILFAITTSGRSENINRAVQTAHRCEMRVIALSGGDGGTLTGLLNSDDIAICVPAGNTARIQEMHLLGIHCLCAVIDRVFANAR